MTTNIGTSYNFINTNEQVEAATPFNRRISYVTDDGRLRVLPTLYARLQYHTRHITAPFRWIMAVPKQYALR